VLCESDLSERRMVPTRESVPGLGNLHRHAEPGLSLPTLRRSAIRTGDRRPDGRATVVHDRLRGKFRCEFPESQADGAPVLTSDMSATTLVPRASRRNDALHVRAG
jgi:hypothetical protein